MYDYGTKEANDAERERVTAQGRAAATSGETSFGAGGYKPGDFQRARDWLEGYRQGTPRCARCLQPMTWHRKDGPLGYWDCRTATCPAAVVQ